mmetsp:Transcript_26368/g.40242  ORF Transcript_26368/g.40242 Transcript_26368/m.40242 type:complete len:83 (+) Transcript_26368:1323-1571(+)
MVEGLKGYSEFDIIEGNQLKNYLAESIVMNYSNIEIHKLLYQQMRNSKQGLPSTYNAASEKEGGGAGFNKRKNSRNNSKEGY